MKAVQVTELTGPDAIRLVDLPEPEAAGGILVEVHAVGVRYPDLLRSKGLYQERSEPPYIPFGEFAGRVMAAPAGSGFGAGDRVAGAATAAGAEVVVAHPSALFRLPPALTFDQGAAIPLNYQTAIFGLSVRGRMRSGESVLVHGASGGTGTAAIQVAKAMGGRVIAMVSTDAKDRIARQAGADDVVRSDGSWREQVQSLTGGRGVDLVWDPVGGDRMLDTLRVLAPLGRWVVIGFVGGPVPQVPLNRVLLKNIDVVGTYFSGFTADDPAMRQRLHDELVALLERDAVRPIVGSVHPLVDAGAALRELEQRRAVGKVVLKVR